MSENWKVQASFKFGTNNADMLNVRAESADELKELIAGITNVDLVGAGNAVRSGVVASDDTTTQRINQVAQALGATVEETYWEAEPKPKPTPPPVPPRYAAPATSAPICQHGPMKLVPAGVRKKTGKPYGAFWACDCGKPRDEQCKAISVKA
jgi:hypothetical protein